MMSQMLPATGRLIEYLRQVKGGSVVSFGELSANCDWNPRHKHLLYTALNILSREGVQFKAVRGVGYERLDPDDGVQHIRRYHNSRQVRCTDRMSRKVEGVNPASLGKEGRYHLSLAQQEVYIRLRAEEQLSNDSVDEQVTRKRLLEQERIRKLKEESNRKFIDYAKANNLG